MGTSPSLISELDAAIQSSSSDKRIATLRRVTDLFLSHAGQYDPEQMKLFDGVLMRMIGHMETRALAELGGRLAPVDGAPLDVIRHLANHDEIVVAGPVLQDSKQLTSDDLVDIARRKARIIFWHIKGDPRSMRPSLTSWSTAAMPRSLAGCCQCRCTLLAERLATWSSAPEG
jgi:hypothetical protein